MVVLTAGEQETVIGVECWACDGRYFLPMDNRGELEQCPYCGARDGQGVQGRTFEVSADV